MEAKLICGDCAEVLKSFSDACIDLTVTSPPYDSLRMYNGYVFDFEVIAQQLYRVTKPSGVVVWVVGDQTINGSETTTSSEQKIYFRQVGFNIHDTMIYEKSGMRYPDNSRYHATFEYMFVFSKGPPGKVNLIRDRINLYSGEKIARKNQVRNKDGSITENSAWRNDPNRRVLDIGVRNNIWRYPSGPENATGNDHPAKFPEALARDHIISWSNPGDTILDPMMGSGTTGKMALKYDRNFIGIDISEEYVAIAQKRIDTVLQQPKLFKEIQNGNA